MYRVVLIIAGNLKLQTHAFSIQRDLMSSECSRLPLPGYNIKKVNSYRRFEKPRCLQLQDKVFQEDWLVEYENITFFRNVGKKTIRRKGVTSQKILFTRTVSCFNIDVLDSLFGMCSRTTSCWLLICGISCLQTFQTRSGTGIVLVDVPDTLEAVGDVRLRSQIGNTH